MSGGFAVAPDRAAALAAVLDALAARGLSSAEVYAKRGRARVIEETPGGVAVSYHREEGWAVRAGDDRSSLFAAATGAPSPDGPGQGGWPEADGEALALPQPDPRESPGLFEEPGERWRDPVDLDAPLIGEREAVGLFTTLREELAAELPRARLLRARLSDGASEWEIASRLAGAPGVAAAARGRAAIVRLEAVLAEGGRGDARPAAATVELAVRAAADVDPRALARRLADRLSVAAQGTAPDLDRAVALFAPAVGARLLASLLPLFFGEAAGERAEALRDRDGRLASDAVTVVDDARLPGGLLAAPIDGEGSLTAPATLIDAGVLRPPLVPRSAPRSSPRRGRPARAGRGARRWACTRRPGWRDLPAPGPSHLYLAPSADLGVGEMLREVARGYYLIDVDGAPRVDLAGDRVSIPVVGFRIEGGAAVGALAGAAVEAGLGSLLRHVETAGRDLTFFPLAGGMIGAPTLRVSGVEIRRR